MSEEKKTDWKFDFHSEDSVKDLAESVVRAENVCNFLLKHLPSNCLSATHFAVANLLVISAHSLMSVSNMLVNYQKIAFDVLKSDQITEACTSE